MIINLTEFDDSDITLIEKVKASHFDDGHMYKQCYLEKDKVIPSKWNCVLPCDVYCPNRIKISKD